MNMFDYAYLYAILDVNTILLWDWLDIILNCANREVHQVLFVRRHADQVRCRDGSGLDLFGRQDDCGDLAQVLRRDGAR